MKQVKKVKKPVTKKIVKRKRRRIRKSVVIGFLAIIILISALIFYPKYKTNKQLKELGYDSTAITAIKKQKLTKTIISNGYYSQYLNDSIKDNTLKIEYIYLYTKVSNLEEKDFLLYNRLLDKGYTKDVANTIFNKLKFYEITPLLVFDYQEDISIYINDCLEHRDVNSETHFELSNDYYSEYENTIAVYDETNTNMLVNKTYYLSQDYLPKDISELSVVYAAKGLSLALEAKESFMAWCDAGMALGIRFYAASSYRSYQSQSDIYNSYINSMGQEKADALSARPGHSEHQTGLTVDLASANMEGLSEYKDTVEYTWTSKNCQDYGWILRYPDGKQSINGYEFESWHYRYLGKELATQVVNSNLTYDEYYCLYLKPWNNSEYVYNMADVNQQVIN